MATDSGVTRLEEIRAACREFHLQHPGCWDAFCRFAIEKAEVGYRVYSAKAVMERVRWETDQGGDFPQFKINDHFTALYARAFMRVYPQFEGFFRLRRQPSETKRAQSHSRESASGARASAAPM